MLARWRLGLAFLILIIRSRNKGADSGCASGCPALESQWIGCGARCGDPCLPASASSKVQCDLCQLFSKTQHCPLGGILKIQEEDADGDPGMWGRQPHGRGDFQQPSRYTQDRRTTLVCSHTPMCSYSYIYMHICVCVCIYVLM